MPIQTELDLKQTKAELLYTKVYIPPPTSRGSRLEPLIPKRVGLVMSAFEGDLIQAWLIFNGGPQGTAPKYDDSGLGSGPERTRGNPSRPEHGDGTESGDWLTHRPAIRNSYASAANRIGSPGLLGFGAKTKASTSDL